MRKEYIKICVKIFFVILLLIIIILGTVYFFKNQYDSERLKTIKTNMLLIKAKSEIIGQKVKMKEKDVAYVGRKIEETETNEDIKKLVEKNVIDFNKKNGYYVLEKEHLEALGLVIEVENAYYIVEYENNEVIYSKGVKNREGKILYTLSELEKVKE